MTQVALTPDMINSLLADTRTRGAYSGVLEEFLGGGEAGIQVDLTSGPLAGKTAAQAAVGFNNARTAVHKDGENAGKFKIPGGENVRVIKRKVGTGDEAVEYVFLIDTAKVSVPAGAVVDESKGGDEGANE